MRVNQATRARLERAGHEFLAEILGVETERNPANIGALADLGHALTRLGRCEEGLAVDEKLVRLDPENPVVHYNLACSLALLERTQDAVRSLERAVELGYLDVDHLLADDDLAPLRGLKTFQSLVRRLRRAAERSG